MPLLGSTGAIARSAASAGDDDDDDDDAICSNEAPDGTSPLNVGVVVNEDTDVVTMRKATNDHDELVENMNAILILCYIFALV